ncbi:hypothetical protein MPTK1_5g21880 [Marchantia polymorpha subsp. ruderalis]|uniref:Uncharacterized protein n=2 Tax=Marchantia polymorpha TaxID=3197 RepID=A0AAF6BKX6_MARPO|nr:hypothetical protein MARPO_0106s0011 [Marchantia polymorpha]BBN12660.1 hypothetical protein Mp_5g21880 [Marchantia polymorpha subsp. ruderalis]|eukprot:PTQ31809.1 hypothetical protein MARPO_0106s0011 [Marchantia polymorpha]
MFLKELPAGSVRMCMHVTRCPVRTGTRKGRQTLAAAAGPGLGQFFIVHGKSLAPSLDHEVNSRPWQQDHTMCKMSSGLGHWFSKARETVDSKTTTAALDGRR